MILSTRGEDRSFTVGFKGERFTVTHIPAEYPDDVGRHIYNLFGPYLTMELTVVPIPLIQEAEIEIVEEPEPEITRRTKRKHK